MITSETWEAKDRASITKAIRYVLIVEFITCLLFVFVPNRQTMILVAASEVGEKVLTNDKVTNIIDPSIDLLQTWIKNELTNLKKEK